MSEMKKYMDIIRLGHKSTVGVLNEGDNITITEKLDGANASFKKENGIIKAFSRNTELNVENNLKGFYQWTQTLDVNSLLDNVIYFGEWLIRHTIKYQLDKLNQFYLYDIYNENYNTYLDFSFIEYEANKLNINLIPLFYKGEYQSFEHLKSFVGKTVFGEEKGEGIVVKNVGYKNKYGNQIFVKLVTEEFSEVQKQKPPKDPNRPITAEQEFINMCLTKARVDKLLHKLIDEGIIEEEFGIEDMGLILKNLGSRVYEDIIKEESDSLPENHTIQLVRKAIGNKLPSIIKDILKLKAS